MSDAQQCYLAALRILRYRWNSVAELRAKLARKDFDDASIAATLERLHAEKWLDDDRFAGAFVRTRARQHLGPRRIRHELDAAGVSSESIARALAENMSSEGEAAALLTLCERKIRALDRRHGAGFAATSEGRNKLTFYLLKQGYDAGTVYEAVRDALRRVAMTAPGDMTC